MSLLRQSKFPGQPMVDHDWEWHIDKLFVHTAAGRPKPCYDIPKHNLLDLATERGLRPLIPLLRKRGYDLELLDAYSLEALVQDDAMSAVAAYLEAGISPDIRCNAGRSLLMVASAFHAKRVALLLLEWKADVHQRSGFGQWTALMWAAHAGWTDGCQMLLEAGARLEDQNSQGFTAEGIAELRHHQGVLDVLRGRA